MDKKYKVAECSNCKRVRFIAAKELCRACYGRLQRHGTVELKSRKKSSCKVDGCERVVISHGFCEKHWDRVVATGDPSKTLRPDDWGKRSGHPLYHSWAYAKQHGGIAEQWLRFWSFVADVKERPSRTARLFRIREDEPVGPDNHEWREPLVSGLSGATYARKHRKANPDYWRDKALRKEYGITLQQYKEMLVAQDGKCALCGGENEGVIDRWTGRPRSLAVDHCHAKGHVRKLLCNHCNNGLGSFNDDPMLLRKAADYVESHQ